MNSSVLPFRYQMTTQGMSDDETILEQVNAVLQHSQYLPTCDMRENLKTWKKNKSSFWNCNLFHQGQYIIESTRHIHIELSEESKKDRFDRFLHDLDLMGYVELETFLDAQRPGFYENTVVEEWISPQGYTIRRGSRIVKAFKYFFSESDKQGKLFKDEVSRIMNQNIIDGTLCLSIHPLDYLSISENNQNWSTCHSLDSDYRTGNLNYMCDGATVVAYVKTGKDDQRIPHFPKEVPWNSKAWRVLLFFNDRKTFIMAGRQYPLECPETMDAVSELLNAVYNERGEVEPDRYWGKWNNSQIKEIKTDDYIYHFSEGLIPMGNALMPVKDIYKIQRTCVNYNDIITNPYVRTHVQYCYLMQRSWYQNLPYIGSRQYTPAVSVYNSGLEIHVGYEATCPICKKQTLLIPNLMVCETCGPRYLEDWQLDEEYFARCPYCGARGAYDTFAYIEDTEEYVCRPCYDAYQKNIKEKRDRFNGTRTNC